MKDDRPRKKTETVEITYKVFYPGDKVIASSSRSELDTDKVYTVTGFTEPLVPYETSGIVFVEGEYVGKRAEYIRLAPEE